VVFGPSFADTHPPLRRASLREDTIMLDVIFIAAGLAFFAVAILYTVACDRL
jgi:hypothetical protein